MQGLRTDYSISNDAQSMGTEAVSSDGLMITKKYCPGSWCKIEKARG